jgi:CheY-like chemotaxis protein
MSILIVEDDEGVRRSLQGILEDEGYSVEVAKDGGEALKRLQSEPLPSLILLDLTMPRMDGEEFRVRQLGDARLATVPVIVLTARPDGKEKARQLQAADYLPKPMSFEELLHVVQNQAITVVAASDLPGAPKTIEEAWSALSRKGLHFGRED